MMQTHSRILISGLVNVETTVQVRQFPIPYYPIDYPFFGVNTAAAGVARNLAGALHTLGDEVRLFSMTGADFQAAYIKEELRGMGIGTDWIHACLRQTPSSAVLYDPEGRRQIYCDLKDIQETEGRFEPQILEGVDLVAACNINFNRPLLALAKAAGKPIATDVHVLPQIDDAYNRAFMEAADILFLSDEAIGEQYQGFLRELAHTYGNRVIVLGRGGRGAALWWKEQGRILEFPAVQVGPVVNTVGAGDALFSAFVHYYAAGMEPPEALLRAELFASAKIGTSGAAKGFVDARTVAELYDRFAEEVKRGIRC